MATDCFVSVLCPLRLELQIVLALGQVNLHSHKLRTRLLSLWKSILKALVESRPHPRPHPQRSDGSVHPGLGVRCAVNRNNTPLSTTSVANLQSSDVGTHTHLCSFKGKTSTGISDHFNDKMVLVSHDKSATGGPV